MLGAATNDVNDELCAREYFNKHIIDNPSIEWKFEFDDGTTQKDYLIPTKQEKVPVLTDEMLKKCPIPRSG